MQFGKGIKIEYRTTTKQYL